MKLLFEGIRVTKSILDKVLKESDDIQMGFECEFNIPYDMSEVDSEINVFRADNYQDVKQYFTVDDPELDRRALKYYIDDNDEELANEGGFDDSEVSKEFIDKKLDEKHWYRDYLDEHDMWDYDANKPIAKDNVPNEQEAKDRITKDIERDLTNVDGVFYKDHMNSERVSFIAEYYTDEEIAQKMYDSDPGSFFLENGWEFRDEYKWTDESMGTIELVGMQFMPVINSFDERFMTKLVPIDYHTVTKENDTWYIEPDTSLGEYGVEVSSAVYPLLESLSIMEQFFEFMQEEEYETDESTGLHVSLSFINNDDVNIDWIKLALLIGEEHTLKQFDRIGNIYTRSQIEKIEKYIQKADISKLKNWEGFKELSSMAVSTLKEKDRAFNIQNFYNEGRVEFRIIGNAGYEKRYEEIRYHILRFVMMMKIASDEDLFKKEYMKKFGTLLLRAKEDSLDTSGVEVTQDVTDNKYFKMAKQLFRGRKDIAKLVAQFIQTINTGSKEEAIDYLVSLANVATNDNLNAYQTLFESAKSEKLSVAKQRLLRSMAADYGFTKEDFENHFNKNIDPALSAYVPIADEILGGNSLGSLAYQLLTPTPEQEAKINRNRNWFIKRIPILRKVNKNLRQRLLKAIAPTLSPFDADRGSDLTDTFQQLVNLAYKDYPNNEQISDLLLEILQFRNQEWDELNLNELTPKELRYLGVDVGSEADSEENIEQSEVINALMNRYSSVMKRQLDISNTVLEDTFYELLFGDKAAGENALFWMLSRFRLAHRNDDNTIREPVTDTPIFIALNELATRFKPGTNAKTLTNDIKILQQWYKNNWLP